MPIYEQIVWQVKDKIQRGELHAGDELPTVRDLARQLNLNQNTVFHAYTVLRAQHWISGKNSQGTRVADKLDAPTIQSAREIELKSSVADFIQTVIGRGFKLPEIEKAFFQQGQIAEQSLMAVPGGVMRVGLGSHDLCLELLLAYYRRNTHGFGITFGAVGSMGGLIALSRSEADFATTHLYDANQDDYNMPIIRKLMPKTPLTLITLVERTQGLIVAKGNPKGIASVKDLTQRNLRYVNRQRGAGTRVLFDDLLRKAKISPSAIHGYTHEEKTHTDVAAIISKEEADVGMGIESSAQMFELDFIPIKTERYEVVVRKNDALVKQFTNIIRSPDFKQAIKNMGGYLIENSGSIRYSLN